jgi:hypothetical protein
METMKLTTKWDLDLDGYGNLATVSEEAAIAQNVATTCLVWRGEYYWDTSFGVPYKNILGEQPPLSSISAYLSECAKTVDEVNEITIDLKRDNQNIRLLKGNITINGEINVSI